MIVSLNYKNPLRIVPGELRSNSLKITQNTDAYCGTCVPNNRKYSGIDFLGNLIAQGPMAISGIETLGTPQTSHWPRNLGAMCPRGVEPSAHSVTLGCLGTSRVTGEYRIIRCFKPTLAEGRPHESRNPRREGDLTSLSIMLGILAISRPGQLERLPERTKT